NGSMSREITVAPLADEGNLRYWEWAEQNRQRVLELSDGRVGYLHVANTLSSGIDQFNRDFLTQIDKEELHIDDRCNTAGHIPTAMIARVAQTPLHLTSSREVTASPLPPAIYGPKVMISNEYSGSGGDALPWLFRRLQLGTIIGKRTWGGFLGA